MATILCQGLQSCLESHLVESRTLRLKLTAAVAAHHFTPTPLELGIKSCFSENKLIDVHENKVTAKNPDLGGWSFLQAVTNTSKQQDEVDKQNVYVPSEVYKSPSATKLTEKSLELCTEDLGSETGTVILEGNNFSSSCFEAELRQKNVVQKEKKKQRFSGGKKRNAAQSFPPPLTTISGSEYLQVRPHREDGRLIIKAVKSPSSHSCFQAERSNGRLRLCISKDFAPNFESEADIINTQEEDTEPEDDEEVEGENVQEELGEKLECGETEVKTSCSVEAHEEGNGICLNVGSEEGLMMDKFERPTSSRCKEGGENEKKGLLNWEPFWVAT